MPLCFIESELYPLEVLHNANRDYRRFSYSCDLDLDPMTFIYELDPHSLEIHRMCKYDLPESSFLLKLSSDRQTYRPTNEQLSRQTKAMQLLSCKQTIAIVIVIIIINIT